MAAALRPYFGSGSVYWWCGSFQSQFGAEVLLSPEFFQLLAEFGAPLRWSCCFSEPA